jgi:putative hemolysin
MSIAFEVVVIFILLVINGLFSMSELAVVTAERIRLERSAEKGSAGARAALCLARDPDNFLSTVQVGMTVVSVFASAYGGANLRKALAASLEGVSFLRGRTDDAALVIVVTAITFLSVIIGELVPKRIALGNAERIAAVVSRPMLLLSRMVRPLITILTTCTQLVLRLFDVKGPPKPSLTEDEVHAVVEQGAESGVVPEHEHEIVDRVFRLGDRRVASIMTPRDAVRWVDASATSEEFRRMLASRRRPWVLVCAGGIDHLVGVAHVGDILSNILGDGRIDIRAAVTEPLFVRDTMPAVRLLEKFRQSGQHVAVVLDDARKFAGVIGLDDLVVELVGDLPGFARRRRPGRPDGQSRLEPLRAVRGSTSAPDPATRPRRRTSAASPAKRPPSSWGSAPGGAARSPTRRSANPPAALREPSSGRSGPSTRPSRASLPCRGIREAPCAPEEQESRRLCHYVTTITFWHHPYGSERQRHGFCPCTNCATI